MVDFSKTEGVQLQSAVPISQPVVDTSGEISAKGLGSSIESISKVTTGLLDTFVEGKSAGVVNDFLQTQLTLADAVDQGGMNSKEARMRARANVATALNDNPRLSGEILKAHKEFITTAGLGQVVDEGTAEEQRQKTRMDDASKAGFLLPGVSVSEGMARYDAQQSEINNITLASKRIALPQANVNLTESQSNLQNSIDSDAGRAALTSAITK